MNIESRPAVRLYSAARNAFARRQFSHQNPKSKFEPLDSNFKDQPKASKKKYVGTGLGHKFISRGHSVLKGQPLRRSFLYVPAHNQRFIDKALTSSADCIVLDLEDGVAQSEKELARKNIDDLFTRLDTEGYRPGENRAAEVCIRVNNEGWLSAAVWEMKGRRDQVVAPTQDLSDDLELFKHPWSTRTTMVVPKVNNPVNLKFLRDVVAQKREEAFGNRRAAAMKYTLKMVPIIETPHGVLNIPMFTSFGRMLHGMVFASEDYCASLGIPRTEDYSNMLVARSMMVNVCKMMGVSPIDMVCQEYKRPDILLEECNDGVFLGFEGKQTIHPDQIDLINKAFAPRPSEVKWAKELLEAVMARPKEGAFEFQGKMVDRPVFLRAENTLAKHRAIERYETNRFQPDVAHAPAIPAADVGGSQRMNMLEKMLVDGKRMRKGMTQIEMQRPRLDAEQLNESSEEVVFLKDTNRQTKHQPGYETDKTH
ncbi:hypothetical protein H072_1231 [Dactylellina haptotyla CBS 200.50]|uniref:HpcH/HpaI aldolase/citrate lyase domain-containing protein n=1 Tax=Dactylellina haptotyla (strain CBS 200.50) TaxID=1284197 RepID=S8AV05_DACHA|nr:hypothetical protein H072_1231 [Dactylellina haptotyla CBS 200.50]